MGVLIPKLIMNSIRKKIIYIPTARAPMSLFVLAVAGSVLFFPFMPSTLEAEETTVTDSLNSFRTGFSPALILFYGNLIDYSADTTTVGSDSTTINSKLAPEHGSPIGAGRDNVYGPFGLIRNELNI